MSAKTAKQRLDILLVERGLVASRTVAQGLIMSGRVRSGDRVLDKPGLAVAADIELMVKDVSPYLSRGGDKLASVADEFGLNFADKTVLDVGSSTGGFTDFALKHGARHVYCVDVGSGQLAYKLRGDSRVTVMERTDIRDVETLPEVPSIAVVDVSFIAVSKVLEKIAELIDANGQIVALLKPQFEAGKIIADRFAGVINDEKVRQIIISEFEAGVREHFEIIKSADSGVHGAQGNIERFYWLHSKR